MKKIAYNHVPAKYKQLVYLLPIILLELGLRFLCEIWVNFVKIWYFVNKCLI